MDLDVLFRALRRLFGDGLASFQSLLIWLVAVGLVFVLLERVWYARRQAVMRQGLRQDLALYFIGGLVPPLFSAAATIGCLWLGRKLLPQAWFDSVHALPIWLLLLLLVVAGDALYYWAHRLSHQIPWLWRLHAVHHSPTEMDWLVNTRAHPLDLVFSHVGASIPLLILGLTLPPRADLGALLFGMTLFNTYWAFFIHSNCRLRLGLLEQLITTPAFHHWHHTNDSAEVRNKNYAALFPWLDRIFGSHYLPKHLPGSYGSDTPVPEGIRAVLIAPFKREPK